MAWEGRETGADGVWRGLDRPGADPEAAAAERVDYRWRMLADAAGERVARAAERAEWLRLRYHLPRG